MSCCCRAAGLLLVATALSVSAAPVAIISTSSNPALVPNENIVISGAETNRTVTITPVSDGQGSATLRFLADGVLLLMQGSSVTNSQNDAPVVYAGSDRLLPLNQALNLSPVVIDDGLPNPPGQLSILWSVVEAPTPPIIAAPTAAFTSVRFIIEGRYTLRITVTDGEFTVADEVTVVVLPPEPTGPAISEVTLVSITESNAVITWKTSRPANSEVQYGTTSSYGLSSGLDASMVTTHRVELTNLVPNTWYYYRVLSRDAMDALSVSPGFGLHTLAFAVERTFYLPLLVQDAQLESPMALLNPEVDFHQQYLASPVPQAGNAVFTFYVPEDGTYTLWCRVRAPTSSQNAFYVAVDGITDIYDVAETKWSPDWQWDVLNARTDTANVPRRLTLLAGLHELAFDGLEPDTRLSRLLLTNDPDFIPADGQPIVHDGEDIAVLTNSVMKLSLNPGFSLIANPFHRGGNTLAEVFPGVPDGTRLFKYNPLLNRYSECSFTDNQWNEPEQTFGPGEGAFIWYPPNTGAELVFTGSLRLSNPVRVFTPGFYLISLSFPRSGKISEVIDLPILPGDIIFKFNANAQVYEYFEFGGDNPPFDVAPGEAFFFWRR
jgi:hypothetical protein